MTDLPHEQDTAAAPSNRKSNAGPILWTLTGILVLGLAGAGTWYVTQGFLKNPDETGQQIRAAYMQGDSDGIYKLLDPQAQQTLSAAFIQQAVQLNSNHKAIALDYKVTKGEGYFNRDAEVSITNPNTKVTQKHVLLLEDGNWTLKPHSVIVSALNNQLVLLNNGEGRFTPPNFFNNQASVVQLTQQTEAYVQSLNQFEETATNWIRSLSAYDPAFKTDLLKKISSSVATETTQANDNLSWRKTYAIRNNISNLLTKANDLYEQANFPKALSLLQQVLKEDSITDDSKASAYYLMSFVYRDYKEAPNNMQSAINMARESTEVEASNSVYWCQYGDLLRLYDLPEKAISAFKRGLAVTTTKEEKADCLTWMGVAYQNNKDFYSAADSWRKAIALVPTKQDALRFLDRISEYGY